MKSLLNNLKYMDQSQPSFRCNCYWHEQTKYYLILSLLTSVTIACEWRLTQFHVFQIIHINITKWISLCDSVTTPNSTSSLASGCRGRLKRPAMLFSWSATMDNTPSEHTPQVPPKSCRDRKTSRSFDAFQLPITANPHHAGESVIA